MIPAIRVTRELYDGADSPCRMAFSISFPDGTGCWSHNTANVAARIAEYRAAAKRPVDVDWRIGDIPCSVQVDGTIPANPPLDTPWGRADHVEPIAEGIWFLATPSHGGVYLDAERNAKVPADWRNASHNGQGRAGWYEEDIDWSMAALTHPDCFISDVRGRPILVVAQETFDYWIKPKLPRPPVERDEDIDSNEGGDLSPEDERLAEGLRT